MGNWHFAASNTQYLVLSNCTRQSAVIPADVGEVGYFGTRAATAALSFHGAASQTMAVPSRLPVNKLLPSGETATVVISCVWPVSVRISLPVAGSHNLAVM